MQRESCQGENFASTASTVLKQRTVNEPGLKHYNVGTDGQINISITRLKSMDTKNTLPPPPLSKSVQTWFCLLMTNNDVYATPESRFIVISPDEVTFDICIFLRAPTLVNTPDEVVFSMQEL